MADWLVLTITAACIIGVVLLIVVARINPVVSLVIGAAALGLGVGLGPAETTATIMTGFGDIMAEIGLLIAWGVLMGAILNATGAIPRLVDKLLGLFGARLLPYGMGLTIGVALQSIFLDVLLVMTAPLARRMSPRLGRLGTARLATALAVGLECGIVLMVPGVATLALAGILGVPLGEMLLFGLIVIIPTIIVTLFIMNFLYARGFWNPEKDEQPRDEDAVEGEPALVGAVTTTPAADISGPQPQTAGVSTIRRSGSRVGLLPRRNAPRLAPGPERAQSVNLLVYFLPMIVSLLLIGAGAVLEIAAVEIALVDFVSEPVIALLIGLLGTSFLARATIGGKATEDAVVSGFKESGQILILTGAGGALAAVVAATGLGEILAGAFTSSPVAPLLVVWVIAAILHIAVGSVSISAITAAGILAPVAATLGLNPVLIALAAGAGSLFAVHVTSNTFWLLQTMLGQTTRGTLKSCTVAVSLASVVALGFTLVVSLFL